MKKTVWGICGILIGCGLFSPSATAQSDDLKKIEKKYNNFDQNKNGQVTHEEFIAFWTGQFEKSDANDDGVLDQTEFLHAKTFQARDVNKDGVIELEEELAVRNRHWSIYNGGTTGRLSLDEFVRFVRGRPARSGYIHETTFNKMDADQNGSLTGEEYVAFWIEYFENRDLNQDNVLNPTEHNHEDSFNSFDADRNGSIEREEDVLIRRKDFRGLDKDGNGSLTQSEFVR